jgi:hypothetical protein
MNLEKTNEAWTVAAGGLLCITDSLRGRKQSLHIGMCTLTFDDGSTVIGDVHKDEMHTWFAEVMHTEKLHLSSMVVTQVTLLNDQEIVDFDAAWLKAKKSSRSSTLLVISGRDVRVILM